MQWRRVLCGRMWVKEGEVREVWCRNALLDGQQLDFLNPASPIAFPNPSQIGLYSTTIVTHGPHVSH